MAKKQRVAQRAPRSASPTRYSQGVTSTTPTSSGNVTSASGSGRSAAGRGMPARSVSGRTAVPVDYVKEYGHVASDLRRVGLLAASLFAVIIILSFVVR